MTDERAQETPKPVPTGVELAALDPVFRADPYPVLADLREREPVHYDQAIHRWVLTRAQDIERVLRDRGMSVDPRKANEGTYMSIFQRFGPIGTTNATLRWGSGHPTRSGLPREPDDGPATAASRGRK